jgi:hypothetical protein
MKRIGERCIVDTFSIFSFNLLFLPLVKRVCTSTT